MRIKIFWPRNSRCSYQTLRAKPGEGFTDFQIELILGRVLGHVEQKFPAHEYSIVPVGPAAFNFVWRGEKPGNDCSGGLQVEPAPEPDFDSQLEEEKVHAHG
jgi:hypothetical protein